MNRPIRIALVGDFSPAVVAHQAIPPALARSAAVVGVEVTPEWVHTSTIGTSAARVEPCDAIWCVPASPYANTAGALAAIRFARETRLPFLGTCGGFQHAVLEYTRNALGHHDADHAETSPEATMPVISRLSCSLVEQSGSILPVKGSRLATIYGTTTADEGYHCNYGLNPAYERLLAKPTGLRVAARDPQGEVRAVELPDHSFFIATLFQPERSSLCGVNHPLINAFVAASAGMKP